MIAVPPIGIVAPTVAIAERSQEIARELGMSDMVYARVYDQSSSLQNNIGMAKRMVEEGAEVLISRRSTAVMINESLGVPNVTLPVTLEDLSLALSKARAIANKPNPRIGLFVMPGGPREEAEAFSKYLGLDFRLYSVSPDDEYLAHTVERAIAEKMDVLIAGMLATIFAEERNLPSVLIDSGPVSIRSGLEEARRIVQGRRLEQTRAEHFRIVVETSYHGVLVLDGTQSIVVANPAAHDILASPPVTLGWSIADVLPELDLSPCFAGGEKLQNVFLNTAHGPLILNAAPALVTGAVKGVVVSFQRAESVNELVVSARNSLHSQGFSSKFTFSSIIGESPSIKAAKRKAQVYAAASGSVLLVGETGTGKELFAHAIHHASAYAQGPFIPINCAAIPSALLESELFGYEEGAFTGATRKGKAGFFELAHQGTIFLDEISELGTQAQLRLLRVLQERCVIRLGGSKLIPIDIRIIAATNKNLLDLVEDGTFRRDLFFRLSVLPVFVPALPDRKDDILLLARSFLAKSSPHGRPLSLKKSQLAFLEAHDWPGNVRELQSAMERFAITCSMGETPDMETILAPDLEWKALRRPGASVSISLSAEQRQERDTIADALRRCNGRRGEAARILGMDRTTLFRKMSAFGMGYCG